MILWLHSINLIENYLYGLDVGVKRPFNATLQYKSIYYVYVWYVQDVPGIIFDSACKKGLYFD